MDRPLVEQCQDTLLENYNILQDSLMGWEEEEGVEDVPLAVDLQAVDLTISQLPIHVPLVDVTHPVTQEDVEEDPPPTLL